MSWRTNLAHGPLLLVNISRFSISSSLIVTDRSCYVFACRMNLRCFSSWVYLVRFAVRPLRRRWWFQWSARVQPAWLQRTYFVHTWRCVTFGESVMCRHNAELNNCYFNDKWLERVGRGGVKIECVCDLISHTSLYNKYFAAQMIHS